jgi:hypothetical protein
MPVVPAAGTFLYLEVEEAVDCVACFFWAASPQVASFARRQQPLLLCIHRSCSSQVTGGVPCMQNT